MLLLKSVVGKEDVNCKNICSKWLQFLSSGCEGKISAKISVQQGTKG